MREAKREVRLRWPVTFMTVALLVAASLVAQAQTPVQRAPSPATPSATPVTTTPQQPGTSGEVSGVTTPAMQVAQPISSQFVDPTGQNVEQLLKTGFSRRADLLAARQRLAIAEGRLIQAGLKPNPTLEGEYGSGRFLAGSAENVLDVGISQLFEIGGKRRKRIAVARLEVDQIRAEVSALERQLAAEVRAAYARAIAAGRQLDVLERLIAANEELVRVTNERLKEGDVAPLELNIVRVETDRLRAQVIQSRAELEGEIISLRALAGFEMTEPLRIAPLPDRPPRLDLSVMELTEIALRERPDLRAARLGEELGSARIQLARAQATPNITGSVRYTRERRITDLPEELGVGPVGQTDNTLRFGVAVDIPIFNKNQGEIASAVGERVQAERQREFLEATIKRDVALAYRRYRAAAEAVVLYATQILPRSEENVRSVRAAYTLGEFSVFDIVNEQRRLLEGETGYNEALRNYYSALAELERSLGTPLPSTGFAPISTSILPEEFVPQIKPAGFSLSADSSPAGSLPATPGKGAEVTTSSPIWGEPPPPPPAIKAGAKPK